MVNAESSILGFIISANYKQYKYATEITASYTHTSFK